MLRGKAKRITITILALAVALLVTQITAQPGAQRTADNTDNATRAIVRPSGGGPPGGVGTLVYDNDVPFARDGQDDGFIGNRFVAGVMDPHTFQSMSFRLAGNYTGAGTTGSLIATVWNVDTANTMATVINRLQITGAPGITLGGTNTVTMFTVVAPLSMGSHSGSFLAGLRNTFYDGCGGNTGLNSTCDGVAITQGTADPGNGFNAARLLFTGPFSPTVTVVNTSGQAIAGTNAIIRVTGDNLPVELMSFDID